MLRLGDWYLGLADDAKGVPRRLMLMRSQRYFTEFVVRHKAEDELRLKAKLRIGEVEQGIWETDRELVRRAGRHHWIDLLTVTEPAKDAAKGRWHKDEVGLHSGGSSGAILYFPVKATGSYEIEVFFNRTHGETHPDLLLPSGEHGGLLVIGGWGGDKTGLHEIKRRSGEKNETTYIQPIMKGRRYRARVRVVPDGKNATIKVWLDGKEIISWRGKQEWFHHKAIRPDRRLGLAANQARIEFHSVKLRIIKGKAELLGRE